ncbi:MAG: 4'-phosphopantetheinyl transferase superfamily protein [Clostridia bacterium]|nr:4'-phosphopantetheinyl transferase superfamily protein [Clostridia bacterium]
MTVLQLLPLPEKLSSRGMVLYMAEGERPETWSHDALLTALRLYTGRTYKPEDVVRVPNEKPYLRDGGAEFSVTHSGEIWMVCIAPFPVGLDLQKHKEKYSPGVAKRYFHPSELALLEKARTDGMDLPLFFSIWCARESYAKFTGDGVAGMDKNYTTTASPVPLYEIPFRQGYSLTLCTAFEE